jgi:hypothetical protein
MMPGPGGTLPRRRSPGPRVVAGLERRPGFQAAACSRTGSDGRRSLRPTQVGCQSRSGRFT